MQLRFSWGGIYLPQSELEVLDSIGANLLFYATRRTTLVQTAPYFHPNENAMNQRLLGLIPMTGRDPFQEHRQASFLELLYDLTLVISFGVAGAQFAHSLAEGHFLVAIPAYLWTISMITWCWVNYSWFASAYDTDDWYVRICVIVQMVGVTVLGTGIPTTFHSLTNHQGHLDLRVMVAGYVIMRLAMLALWGRAWFQDPSRRPVTATYFATLLIAQVAWVVLAAFQPSLLLFALCFAIFFAVELSGPYRAESKLEGTPWHADHIVERYGLLVIISLGEGLVGTTASVRAYTDHHSWDLTALLLVIAGVSITAAMWWFYFSLDVVEAITQKRTYAFPWGYLHMLVFGAIAATGAALEDVALLFEGESQISAAQTLVLVCSAIMTFYIVVFSLYQIVMRTNLGVYWLTLLATGILMGLATALTSSIDQLATGLLIVMLAAWIPVLGTTKLRATGKEHPASYSGGESQGV